MSALAAGLPNQGNSVAQFGLVITLSVFAAELKALLPDFVDFANEIASGDIDADVVKNTANAAKAMSALAAGLPNQGGIGSWFTGDNTLSAFAEKEKLVIFAPKFSEFAKIFAV